jgi:hypothetical protein
MSDGWPDDNPMGIFPQKDSGVPLSKLGRMAQSKSKTTYELYDRMLIK